MKRCYCAFLPNFAFSCVTLVAWNQATSVTHSGNLYIVEVSKQYKSWLDLLFILKKVMEKMLEVRFVSVMSVALTLWVVKIFEVIFFKYLQTVVWFSKEGTHLIDRWVKSQQVFHGFTFILAINIKMSTTFRNHTHLSMTWGTSLPNWVIIKHLFIVLFCQIMVELQTPIGFEYKSWAKINISVLWKSVSSMTW